jgi:hypothetical protein
VESLGSLLAAARQAGGQVLSIWPRRETLEDMFIKEIGRGTGGEEKR